MDKEQVEELIKLNPEQQNAFNRLKRAVAACKKSNIYFYQVLESLHCLNGDNVQTVEDIDRTDFKYEDPRNLQYLNYQTVKTDCSWADDTHVVILK